MILLQVENLRKSYGSHVAVQDVSFSLDQGEVFGLLGPNGAGKSTTMMMLAGLLLPDSGTIRLGSEGTVYDARNPEHRRQLGVVPQDLAIYPELNAVENLRFFGGIYGMSGATLQRRIDDVLSRVGLTGDAHRASHEYSGGMKRRLNFGVALLHSPKLLILDEPTVGVDPQSRSHMMDTVRNVSAEGVAVIYASHYMEEVQAICERVAIIDHGQMLACDSLSTLLNRVTCDVFLRVRGSDKLASLLQGAAEVRHATDGEALVVIATEHRQTKAALNERLPLAIERLRQAGIEIKSVETRESNLERLFLELTGRKLRD